MISGMFEFFAFTGPGGWCGDCCPSVGAELADIICVNCPGPCACGMRCCCGGRCGLANAPVADWPSPPPRGGAGFAGAPAEGVPNNCVNSPARFCGGGGGGG